MQKKKAVSLVVLVITIIVMIILAGTIILSLRNSGIIDKAQSAVDQANLKEIQTLASLKWAEAYMVGNTTQEQLEQEVLKRLNDENVDLTPYEITVTSKGVKVTFKGESGETANWVIATVDGVPIPKGFVASSATGENTKNGGLVIYEGTTPVTDENVEDAKRTRNQYVWVPVEDFSKFIRQTFDNLDTISNTLGRNCWEVVLDTATNLPLPTQSTKYVTSTTLTEVQEMYESVKEYKGFYIARYEAGIDTQRTSETTLVKGSNVYSMMEKIPYTYISWTKNDNVLEDTNGAVEAARSMYPATNTNYGVVSTLTYGVQWDTTLQWWLDTKAVSSVTTSNSYGNYDNHVIAAGDLNDGAKYAVSSSGSLGSYQTTTASSTKAYGTWWALSTGALKAASVNNIYDMAGNMWEWTMEGSSSDGRFLRGGAYYLGTNQYNPVAYRTHSYPPRSATYVIGFRPTLYIKK